MNKTSFNKFVDWLCLRFTVYARKRIGKIVKFAQVSSPENVEYEQKSDYPLRKLFFPSQENLYSCQNENFVLRKPLSQKRVIFGIPLFDLEALTQLTVIFAKDPYFQARIRNTLIIGQSPIPDDHTFYQAFEENVLRHLKFDIYFDYNETKDHYRLFTGSEEGQEILENFGQSHYEHIEYQGPVPRNGLSPYWKKIRDNVKKSSRNQFWKDLGEKCLACGKCTIVCPTCYCYDLETNAEGETKRTWGNCFYSEFSEIAGGHKFLTSIAERIYYWYAHKFVRMPSEYGFVGCVQCGRCTDVCPAEINIEKNLKKISRLKK